MPQGPVLAPMLFIIMGLGTEREIKESILRCLVDDTKAGRMIRSEENKEKMQKIKRFRFGLQIGRREFDGIH